MVIPIELITELSKRKNIVITSHFNPDGDAIGSSLALYHYLTLKEHNVSVMVPNAFPAFLAWMPGSDKILIYEENKSICNNLLSKAEIIFCLDYNAIHRTGPLQSSILEAVATKVLIDHHLEPVSAHFNYLFSNVDTSSTGELVYDYIVKLGDAELLNKDIATGVYVGIMTDTGSFSYSCNNENNTGSWLIYCNMASMLDKYTVWFMIPSRNPAFDYWDIASVRGW